MATVDFTEEAATGENAPDVTDGDAAAGDAEQTTADRMAGRTKVRESTSPARRLAVAEWKI